MILIAQNVLNGIAGRSKQLEKTLVTRSTKALPGFAAYQKALENRRRPRTAKPSTGAGTTGAESAAE